MTIICSLLFLFVNVVGSIHACLPPESEQDENKRAGETQRLINFYENLIAKHKTDKSIPCVLEVPFGLKKTQKLTADTECIVVSDMSSVRQKAFVESVPFDSAKREIPSAVETHDVVEKDKSFSFDNSYVYINGISEDEDFVFVFDYSESDRGCNDYFAEWYVACVEFLRNNLAPLSVY
ncbi:MAG: hypothetical protein WCJ92_05040 [Alphaproteobacteria bacterium]